MYNYFYKLISQQLLLHFLFTLQRYGLLNKLMFFLFPIDAKKYQTICLVFKMLDISCLQFVFPHRFIQDLVYFLIFYRLKYAFDVYIIQNLIEKIVPSFTHFEAFNNIINEVWCKSLILLTIKIYVR